MVTAAFKRHKEAGGGAVVAVAPLGSEQSSGSGVSVSAAEGRGCLLLQSARFVRDVVQVPSGSVFFLLIGRDLAY